MSNSAALDLQHSDLFYGLVYPEVTTESWSLQSLRPVIRTLRYNHATDIPGRGTCTRSSARVVQQSALRWPANILQKKKSISGNWLGWLIWRGRHIAAHGSRRESGQEKESRRWNGWRVCTLTVHTQRSPLTMPSALKDAACQRREARKSNLC